MVRRGSSHVLHYPGQHECVVLAQPAVRLEHSGIHCSSQGFTLLGRLIINPPLDTMSLVTKILADYDDCRLSLVMQLRDGKSSFRLYEKLFIKCTLSGIRRDSIATLFANYHNMTVLL